MMRLIDADQEKMIDLLLIPSKTLEYEDAERIAKYMLSHGVTVREPQKPMTVEEVFDKSKNISDNVVWMEQEDEDGDMCVFPSLVSNFAAIARRGTQYLNFLAWPKQEYVRNYTDNRDYGKTWRCWAEKPTEEEREAAEWQE